MGFLQPFGHLPPRAEGNFRDFQEGNAFDVPPGLVVDLGGEDGFLPFRRENPLQFRQEFRPLPAQFGVQPFRSGCIKGKAVFDLFVDDGRKTHLQVDGLGGEPHGEGVVVDSLKDIHVPFAICLHFRGPLFPVRGFPELALQFPEAVAPGFQGVSADQLAGERVAAFLFPHLVIISGLEVVAVPVEKTQGDQCVEYMAFGPHAVNLFQKRHVIPDGVVGHDDRSFRQDMRGLPELGRGVCGKDLAGGGVFTHDAVNLCSGIKKAVRFAVEENGLVCRGFGNPQVEGLEVIQREVRSQGAPPFHPGSRR